LTLGAVTLELHLVALVQREELFAVFALLALDDALIFSRLADGRDKGSGEVAECDIASRSCQLVHR
jgi:hypothetical protein